MRTMKNILIFAAVAAMSLLASCSKDTLTDNGGETVPGTVRVQLALSDDTNRYTRATTPGNFDENYVGRVQMILWNITTQKLERYISADPTHPIVDDKTVWDVGKQTLTMSDVNTEDNYRIYVMANGTGSELALADTEAKIAAAYAQHDGAIVDLVKDPLPMSGVKDDVKLVSAITVELTRMVAKVEVTVTLDATFTGVYPDCVFGDASGTKSSVQLINAPHLTYILPRTPAEIPADGLVSENTSELPTTESGMGGATTWKTTAYVYENPTVDAATSMKIALNLPYKDGSAVAVTDNLYTVEINHAATAPRVERNYIYQVNMLVNGFGYVPDPVTVTTNILPWNIVEKTPEMGRYVKFAKTTFTDHGGTETPLAEGGNLPEEGGTVKIYCKTNVGGWYVIVRDHGKIVQNTKSTPTRVVTKETEQSLDIAIPAIDYLDGRYTVSIHHQAYASELINQIPPITFTQYGGFIPNSELIKEIEVYIRTDGIDNLVKIGPWPADKLPARGLQIAKIGNVLPTGVAQTTDAAAKWGPAAEGTGLTEARMSFGKSNYAALNNKDATLYPIGQACKHLGPEWYVPSFHELLLIHNNLHQNQIMDKNNKLGRSYQYTYGGHWSTTESGATIREAMVGGFPLVHGGGSKENAYRVRCVREL